MLYSRITPATRSRWSAKIPARCGGRRAPPRRPQREREQLAGLGQAPEALDRDEAVDGPEFAPQRRRHLALLRTHVRSLAAPGWCRDQGADRSRRLSLRDLPPTALPRRLRRWTLMPKGGHFAAMEQPVAVAEAIRAFVRALRAPS